MPFDPQEAVKDPCAFYKEPQQVLDDERLSADLKLKVLKSMEEDAIELMTATDENMPAGEEINLEAVRAALRLLEQPSS